MAGIIVAENLTKKYGQVVALENVSLSVSKGEVIGILGPNGAGKTTLVSVISTLRKPTFGKVFFSGKDVSKDPAAVRREIGIVFQGTSLDPKLTVKETLLLHASLFEMDEGLADKAVQETMLEFSLHKLHSKLIENLSNGQRQLVEIAKSLLHKPKVLIFDEPTVGLDPEVRKLIWDKIEGIAKDGEKTVLITSHYLEEIEQLCEKVVLMKAGKIIRVESISGLKEETGKLISFSLSRRANVPELEKILGAKVIDAGDSFFVRQPVDFEVSGLIRKLASKGFEIRDIRVKEASLEDLYLGMMGDAK